MGIPWDGMGWDGTGMNCYGMGWDGKEKYVPWTSLPIANLVDKNIDSARCAVFIQWEVLRIIIKS